MWKSDPHRFAGMSPMDCHYHSFPIYSAITVIINTVVGYFKSSRVNQTILIIAILIRLYPSLSSSMIKAIPSQSSSTSLLGISRAPGLIRLSRSLQSSSELYPSLSSSMIKAIPSQSSSTSLLGISIAPGLIRLSWSLQSSSELYPSLSSSMIKAIPSQSSSTSLLGISRAPGLIRLSSHCNPHQSYIHHYLHR